MRSGRTRHAQIVPGSASSASPSIPWRCAHGGTRLITSTLRDRDAPSEAAAGDLELVGVLQTADEGLAALVKSILDGNSIKYFVTGAPAGPAIPRSSVTPPFPTQEARCGAGSSI